jgi:hypothetical protein
LAAPFAIGNEQWRVAVFVRGRFRNGSMVADRPDNPKISAYRIPRSKITW